MKYFVNNGCFITFKKRFSFCSNFSFIPFLHNVVPQQHWCISMATGNFQKYIYYIISSTQYKHMKNKQEWFFGKVLGLGEVKG